MEADEIISLLNPQKYNESRYLEQQIERIPSWGSLDLNPWGWTTVELSQEQMIKLIKKMRSVSHLSDLFLMKLKLKTLPPEISMLPSSLRKLNLCCNSLSSLPAELCLLTQLKGLYLGGNQLTTLPPEITKLQQLEELYCNGNLLITVPDEIGGLTSLKKLMLYENTITHLPKEIGKLTNLQRLDIYRNRLVQLPIEIGNLKSLEKLNLCHNMLIELPAQIGKLAKLEGLYLHGNKLRYLPVEISQITNLDLTLTGNLFEEQPCSPMVEVPSLIDLCCTSIKRASITSKILLPGEVVEYLERDIRECTWCGRALYGNGLIQRVHTITWGSFRRYTVPVLCTYCCSRCNRMEHLTTIGSE